MVSVQICCNELLPLVEIVECEARTKRSVFLVVQVYGKMALSCLQQLPIALREHFLYKSQRNFLHDSNNTFAQGNNI